MWTSRHAEALQAAFSALNQDSIEWMVLRNYEGLPHINRAKDIDLVLKKCDFARARRVIGDALSKHDFTLYDHTRFQYVWCFTFFNNKNEIPLSVKIDLLDGFVWRGAQVMEFSSLYAGKVAFADFFVPDQASDGFMLWIKPLMTGGFIKEKYREDILKAVGSYPSEFRKLLETTFGAGMGQELWPHLESGDLEATIPYKRRLCRTAWLAALLRSPWKTLGATAEHAYREMRRRSRRPPASMLAVIGPDGSGKSTFIELLQKELSRILVKEMQDVRVLHFRPNIFPNLRKLLGGKDYDESKEQFSSPHRAAPVGIASSFLRLVYYWGDYLLGYWLRIRSQCIAGKVVIFDRYFYDFIVDPYRSRIRLPAWLRRLFLRMTPEPDLVFVLACDAGTIFERKQELTLPEIERQLLVYRDLGRSSRRFVVLNASRLPEELCNEAIRSLIEMSYCKLS